MWMPLVQPNNCEICTVIVGEILRGKYQRLTNVCSHSACINTVQAHINIVHLIHTSALLLDI